jgi:Pectate lyase superfamily protein
MQEVSMFNEPAPCLLWLLAAGVHRIVLIAFIVLFWSTTWAANNMGAQSLAAENSMMEVATFQNPVNRAGGGPQSIAGPRPYIDVTAYGCRGDAATNDTACIRAAISAACAFTIGGQSVHPIVIFPPGYYFVSQSQTPSTAPVFEIPCSNLTLRGMGTSAPIAFDRAPSVIIQSMPGSSPNGAPIFDVRYPFVGAGFTLQDLQIAGYNKALWIYKTTGVKLDNVTLSVQNTSLADNSALMLTNNFWFEWNGGECAGVEAANKYCILMTGDVPLGGEAPLSGLNFFFNMQGIGGMVRYDQRVNTVGSGPGNWVFDNIRAWEANQGPFLFISNSTGNSATAALPTVTNVTINNVSAADSGGGVGRFPLIELNSPGTNLQGVIIDMSIAGVGGSSAIQLDGGTASSILGCNIRSAGGSAFTAWTVVDSSGNPMPGCSIENHAGFDFIVPDQIDYGNARLRSDIFRHGNSNGPAIRLTYGNGTNRFAGVALDPLQGLMVNTGNDFGFGASIGQTVRGDLDISFPINYPPTSLTGKPITGGSIAAGTYYGTVYSSTNPASCNSTESAPSIQSAAVTLSGSHNAIKWSWTLPIAGVSPVLGYCVAVSKTPNFNAGMWQPAQTNWQFITGGTTTTLTMTALPTTGSVNTTVGVLSTAHRLTANSLGINTTSPVAHTLTQNGGYVCPIATKSSAYTLATGDCRIQVTGTTTITIPHILPAIGLTNIWHVFSISGVTKLACDSGTINASATITIPNNTGKDAYADGTNCFAQ